MFRDLARAVLWACAVFALPSTAALAQTHPVRAVLFYSPTCPHCQFVIENTLVPLSDQYGDQLELLAINTTTEQGQQLYRSAIERFQIPPERQGVPTLIIGDTVLVGSTEIPEQLPALVEALLVQGGIDWPDLPEIRLLLADQEAELAGTTDGQAGPDQQAPPAEPPQSQPSPPVLEPAGTEQTLSVELETRLLQDPLGNTASILVLFGMLISLPAVGLRLARGARRSALRAPAWLLPVLMILGLLVSGYLAWVETSGSEAFCGPVGDCNAVQQSRYAVLFGVLPIGVLGAIGYLVMLLAWLAIRLQLGAISDWARPTLLALALLGVLFSIYLTFLEPFVIGATCVWCLSSAVIMTLLLWLTADQGMLAVRGHNKMPSHG